MSDDGLEESAMAEYAAKHFDEVCTKLAAAERALAESQARERALREALGRAVAWGLCPPGTAMSREIQDEYVRDSALVRAALSDPRDDGALRALMLRVLQRRFEAGGRSYATDTEVADAVLKGDGT